MKTRNELQKIWVKGIGEAFIGFDTFAEADQFIKFQPEDNNGEKMRIHQFRKHDGDHEWTDLGDVYEAFHPSDYLDVAGALYEIADAENIANEVREVVSDMLNDYHGDIDETDAMMSYLRKIRNIQNEMLMYPAVILTENHVIWERLERDFMSFSFDTRTYAIGVC